jgi:predicted DNA-binding protein (UPF0251 family)
MARPEKARRVLSPPVHSDFKPLRIPRRFLQTVDLALDEYEAVRLADYAGLDHAAAASELGISRPTFTRLHSRATAKLARFIVEGLHLSIAGGTVHFRQNMHLCSNCRRAFPTGVLEKITRCPYCGSEDCENLAAHHGHGECCVNASEDPPEG